MGGEREEGRTGREREEKSFIKAKEHNDPTHSKRKDVECDPFAFLESGGKKESNNRIRIYRASQRGFIGSRVGGLSEISGVLAPAARLLVPSTAAVWSSRFPLENQKHGPVGRHR